MIFNKNNFEYDEDFYKEDENGEVIFNRDSSDEDFYSNVVPDRAIKALQSANTIFDRYDAVIIDEGQDFHKSWYKMLKLLLKKNSKQIFVLVVAD